MSKTNGEPSKSTPVLFFSHGSTMMLGEETTSADFWLECGNEALRRGVKQVILMGAHWECRGNKIQVARKVNPELSPIAFVAPEKYSNYKINVDTALADRVVGILDKSGFEVSPNDEFDWIHDTFLILIRMFPKGCPGVTTVSMNARFDPHYHMKIGASLAHLRDENILLVGTGGAVHNLYRNHWSNMVLYRDNLAQEVPPEDALMEFRQTFEDAMTKNSGPALARSITRLMQHPNFRDAHATDDHFIPACFAAGAASRAKDVGTRNIVGAET